MAIFRFLSFAMHSASVADGDAEVLLMLYSYYFLYNLLFFIGVTLLLCLGAGLAYYLRSTSLQVPYTGLHKKLEVVQEETEEELSKVDADNIDNVWLKLV